MEVPLADLEWTVRLPSGYEATWAGGTLVTEQLPTPAAGGRERRLRALPAGRRRAALLRRRRASGGGRIADGRTRRRGLCRPRRPRSPAGPEPARPAAGRVEEQLRATDLQSGTPAEQKILDALNSPTQLEFVDTAAYRRDRLSEGPPPHRHPIDKKAMDDAGIGADMPVTKNLKGVSLRSALRLMLHELGLTYLIQDEVLLITTPEAAESRLRRGSTRWPTSWKRVATRMATARPTSTR